MSITRPAVSEHTSFTAEASAWSSRREISSRAASDATRYSSDFAAMISAAMSASMNSTAWNPTIGRPNCSRSFANASDSSSARAEAPIVRAPIMSRSSTNQSFVSSYPCPTSPST